MKKHTAEYYEEATGVYSAEAYRSAEEEFLEIFQEAEVQARKENLQKVVRRVFCGELTKEEQAVAADYFLEHLTYSEIARKYEITRRKAEHIKHSAEKKLYVFLKYPLLMGFSADSLPQSFFKEQKEEFYEKRNFH